ncbi:hypothetical protein [Parafrankia sp. EUN1f]|nr:hypothetical protein [Parafrankia sp. EUN1f]
MRDANGAQHKIPTICASAAMDDSRDRGRPGDGAKVTAEFDDSSYIVA